MVGKLLVRGMLAGIAAGLLTFAFAKVGGEPQVDKAIAFEQKADAAKGEAPEPEPHLSRRPDPDPRRSPTAASDPRPRAPA